MTVEQLQPGEFVFWRGHIHLVLGKGKTLFIYSDIKEKVGYECRPTCNFTYLTTKQEKLIPKKYLKMSILLKAEFL